MHYKLDGQGSIPGRGKKISSSTQCTERLWDPRCLLSNVYWWFFPWGLNSWVMKLTTHLHLVAEVKNGEAIPPPLISLHGVYIIKHRDFIFLYRYVIKIKYCGFIYNSSKACNHYIVRLLLPQDSLS
jgi:hypothetical protein